MPALFDCIPEAWAVLLREERSTVEEIEKSISREVKLGKRVLPDKDRTFSALSLGPEAIRVVIVGQDPYPDRRYAIGRSFAVPAGTRVLPGSLKNIIKEKISDVGGDAPSCSLREWETQGVLLLNRVLTVNEGESNSHLAFGWRIITDQICRIAAEQGAVGLLWGRNALEVAEFFGSRVVSGVHPSPLSAHKGFFGSKPFSQVNDLLLNPIVW